MGRHRARATSDFDREAGPAGDGRAPRARHGGLAIDTGTIARKLKDFLAREFPNQGVDLTDQTKLLEDWFLDSLQVVETVLFIESEFGVSLARSDINGVNFETVAALSRLIAQRSRRGD